MRDKSSTHQKVVKNGVEGWINKEVWAEAVSRGDTNGFHAVASTPPEVDVLKQKSKELPVEQTKVLDEEKETPEVEVELTGVVKENGKPGPKPKS